MTSHISLCQQLKQAISNKNITEIVSLVENGYDLNASTNPKMVVPLVHAANCRDVAICHLLIDLGALLNGPARPLLNAVYNELDAAVETLLELGCDIKEGEDDKEKYNKFSNYLYPKSCDALYSQKYTCLHVAVVQGNLKIMKLLLCAGCNANAADCFKRTPLHWACEKAIGNPKVVDCLLKYAKNINISAVDDDGLCAIHLAAAKGHAEIVKLLIQAGAITKLDAADQIRLTAAAVKSGNEETLLDILRAGCAADTNDVLICERPLSAAITSDNETFVEILHEFGADFNVCDSNGNFPIHLASRANPRILEYLLKNGADVNARITGEGNYCETALIHAIGNEFTTGKMRLELITMYIHGGAKLNLVDCYGRNALFNAVLAYFDSGSCNQAKSRVNIVGLLLMEGVMVPSLQLWQTAEMVPREDEIYYSHPMYLAVSCSDINLTNLLIAAGGEITTRMLTTIQEKFGSIQFLDCFESFIASPRSLLSVCRLAIRKQLLVASRDRAIGDRIRSLCLPGQLKHYLLFNKEISDIECFENDLVKSEIRNHGLEDEDTDLSLRWNSNG